jgi:Peptidase family S41
MSTAAAATSLPIAPGYPAPVLQHSAMLVAGYFLPNSDVAVLAIPSFDPEVAGQGDEFQNLVTEFLALCKKEGKKKLIVDLSANLGGIILFGYDVFKQIFPSKEPFGANRYRASPEANIMGVAISGSSANATPVDDAYLSAFNYRHYVNESGLAEPTYNFKSWPAMFGPREAHGDNFTNTIRYPVQDSDFDEYYGGIIVSGYGDRSNLTQQVFDSPDIVLLYDGWCASTCAIFSEFMKTQGQVKSIVVGGRPEYGPQQAVGGTKGANDFPFDYLLYEAQAAEAAITDPIANASAYADLPGPLPLYVPQGAVNFRDQIRNHSDFPLHFLYEAADCRLFFTPASIKNVSALWDQVVDVTWNGKAGCVRGSTGHPSALPYWQAPVFKEARGW